MAISAWCTFGVQMSTASMLASPRSVFQSSYTDPWPHSAAAASADARLRLAKATTSTPGTFLKARRWLRRAMAPHPMSASRTGRTRPLLGQHRRGHLGDGLGDLIAVARR